MQAYKINHNYTETDSKLKYTTIYNKTNQHPKNRTN